MNTIVLKAIDETNFYEVINLEVKKEQAKFITSNVQSLAECYLYRNNNDVFPYAICINDSVIGFLLLYSDDEESSMTIWRIMIDKKYQQKGYGKMAMIKAEELIKEKNKYKLLYTSCSVNNINAKKLYLSLNFQEQKHNEYNEIVLVKSISN